MEILRNILKWITKHPIITAVCTLLVIGCGVGIRIIIVRSDGALTSPLQRGKVVDAVYGIGTITATHSYSIKPGVVTTLRDLYVKEGDSVHKGQHLADIDNNVYRAPFDGVVNFLPFKVGENVFAQLPVLVLTDLKDRYCVVTMEQQGALRVRAGQKAKLNFDSIRNTSYEASSNPFIRITATSWRESTSPTFQRRFFPI